MRGVKWTDQGLAIVEVGEPAGDGVVVDVAAAGICGTDLHFLRTLQDRKIIGHEFAGLVDGVPYAIEPNVYCGTCDQCRAGHTQRCVGDRSNIGIYRDGGLADRVLVPAYALTALPPGLDVADASLVEPASVAWHAVRRAAPQPGERVAVVGGGSIGLLVAAVARHLGIEAAVECRHDHQRVAAERLGAVAPVGSYDLVFEAGGTDDAIARSAELVRPGGRVVLLGAVAGDYAIPGALTLTKEITWIGAMSRGRHGGVREFEEAAAFVASDPEIPRTLITHRFTLADAHEAFRVAGDRASGAIKVVLHP